MNLTIFIASYFFIILSVIGYGLFFFSSTKNQLNVEFEFSLLAGLFFLILLSFLTHFFTPHGFYHNLVIAFFGIIFFFFFSLKEKRIIRNYYFYLLLIFGILFIGFLTIKPHDDFPYYHFPYTYYLTQNHMIIGTGSINHGFRTPSSIFYLNSLFYLPIIKYFSFHIGAVLIFGISNLILILKLKNDHKNQRYDFISILTILSLLFINIFFYRISEHGTDRSAQILILVLFIEILSLYRNSVNFNNFFSKIFILLGLIITLKAFYVLYLLILIPIFVGIRKEKISQILKSFFSNIYFYIFILIGFSLIAINIFNSGCVLYPVSLTCFNNLEWSLLHEAEFMNNWYELWSKAGASPNYRVDNPEIYIKGFNWLPNWTNLYFFNKVSDFILGLIFLLLIVFLIFYTKNKKKISINKKEILWTYSIILILFFEWFYNHPSLRYGGYSLIALILFIPFSIYLSKFKLDHRFQKKMVFLIILSMVIFMGRNLNRIGNEVEKYDYDFLSKPFYILNENNFRVDNLFNKFIQKYENCNDKNNCFGDEGILINKKNNYYYLVKTND